MNEVNAKMCSYLMRWEIFKLWTMEENSCGNQQPAWGKKMKLSVWEGQCSSGLLGNNITRRGLHKFRTHIPLVSLPGFRKVSTNQWIWERKLRLRQEPPQRIRGNSTWCPHILVIVLVPNNLTGVMSIQKDFTSVLRKK